MPLGPSLGLCGFPALKYTDAAHVAIAGPLNLPAPRVYFIEREQLGFLRAALRWAESVHLPLVRSLLCVLTRSHGSPALWGLVRKTVGKYVLR